MKSTLLSSTLYSLISLGSISLGAQVQLSFVLGALRDSGGNPVPTGTTVVLIANSNTTQGFLPGGLVDTQLGGGLDSTLAENHFAGQTLAVGATINLDRIIYMGTVNDVYGPGSVDWQGIDIDVNLNGVNTGTSFGVYWFPGLVGLTIPSTGGFEVGGLFNSQPTNPDDLSDVGMIMQGEGSANLVAQFDPTIASDTGLTTPHTNASFTAIAVPEASSLALSVLGLGALLRRRRK